MTAPLARGLWLLLGAALLVLPALPLPAWSNAPDQGPLWMSHVASWGIGLVVVATVGALVGWLGRHADRRQAWPSVSARVAVPVLAVALTVASVVVMLVVFVGNPHLVDEIAQLFHARVFAAGRLAAPAPEPPGAFLITHTWITPAGWVSQYPPGHTLILALGLLARAEWLINPLQAGLSLILVYLVARGLYGRRTALAAAVLWALSAWVMFMSGTYMNHVTATSLTLAAAALVVAPRRVNARHAVAAGLVLAACAATRPLDAVAAAVVPIVWIVLQRRWTLVPWMVLGGTPVMLLWGYLNWRIYGNPLTLGYTAVYGAEHGLGFHSDPWGRPYTPLMGLSNMAIAIRRLHIYLYEWPIPALLPLAIWGVAARRLTWRDLLVACGVAAAPVLYFFYWHSGFYLGPRFYYVVAPFLVIGMARAWRWGWVSARRLRMPFLRADVALATAAVVVVGWGWIGILPKRWDSYSTGLATLKLHPERALAARSVTHALVLVPESWGSRVGVRLWVLGVPPGLGERVYRRLDTCDLYGVIRAAEDQQWSPEETASRLQAVMDTAPPPPPLLATWADPTLRFRLNYTPAEPCQVELRRDLAGFTLYGYLAWRNEIGLGSGVVFARDLYELNGPLLERYPGWEIWRYAPPRDRPNGLPVLTRLRESGSR